MRPALGRYDAVDMPPSPDESDRPRHPGEVPPPGRLARPPSDRYERASQPTDPAGSGAPSAVRALGKAIIASLAVAAILVLVGGILEERRGLIAIAGIGGAVVGLLAASAAVSHDGVAAPVLSRARVLRIAVGLAAGMVVVSALGIWAYGRLEGGVMDPLSYLWETSGLLVPAEAAVAALAAVWGAGAGPVQGRS